MSGYVIDTDWVIDYLKGVSGVVKQLQGIADRGLVISVVSLAELYEGIYGSGRVEQHLHGLRQFLGLVSVIGLDESICQTFGRHRHQLRQEGRLIDNFDLLIAATCVTYGLSLVTNNVRHYEHIRELHIAEFVRPSSSR